ncbi:hypothetical protein [Aureliella helgolandensis]|uniref:Uncharacterized protein n=1 Tax=Aureliella helgolandensis TaxID=2527968 RepID=A0A518G2P2_9BACT|nr:hypothetical protein [Aureliella helgolandensis]QDV22876.1 hypothetical protein Q31a_11690 [Aureliella helgolandensis]
MCDCEDLDPPEFFACDMVKARRPHRCCECFAVIAVGEVHQSVRGKWDGTFAAFRTCPQCVAAMQLMPHACRLVGELHKEIRDDDYGHIPEALAVLDRRSANWGTRRQPAAAVY